MLRSWMLPLGATALWIELALANARVVVLDLVQYNSTDAIPGQTRYGVPLWIGSPPQNVTVFPSLSAPKFEGLTVGDGGEAVLFVPAMEICMGLESDPEHWNPLLEPENGDFISTAVEGSMMQEGMTLVRWTPTQLGGLINISLRKGAANVTVLEKGILNDGVYPWNASETARRFNLKPGSDYSIMLWSDNPPRKSVSGFFSMASDESELPEEKSVQSKSLAERCLQDLTETVGYYNVSADLNYVPGEQVADRFVDGNSSWSAAVIGKGMTTVQWRPTVSETGLQYDSNIISRFNASDVPFARVNKVYEGIGIVDLVTLQKMRNEQHSDTKDGETNVVGLFLGQNDMPGNVVMGGYNRAIIDFDRSAEFTRIDGGHYVEIGSITVIDHTKDGRDIDSDEFRSESGEMEYSIDYGREAVRLSYETVGMRLPTNVIEALLPKIGSPARYHSPIPGYPAYSGYKYSGEPNMDWSLRFNIRNGTRDFDITVPGREFFIREASEHSPLTSRIETGKIYLAINPTPDGDERGSFLGRSVLRHLYFVDDSNLEKFFLSAVDEAAARARLRNVVTGSYLLMTSNKRTEVDQTSNLGAILGGILGGVAVLAIGGAAIFYLVRRRNEFRGPSDDTHFATADFTPPRDSEKAMAKQQSRENDLRDLQIFRERERSRHFEYGAVFSEKPLETVFPLPPTSTNGSEETISSLSGASQTRLSPGPPIKQLYPKYPSPVMTSPDSNVQPRRARLVSVTRTSTSSTPSGSCHSRSSSMHSRPRPPSPEPSLPSRTASIARVVTPREISLTPTSSTRRRSDQGLMRYDSNSGTSGTFGRVDSKGHRRIKSEANAMDLGSLQDIFPEEPIPKMLGRRNEVGTDAWISDGAEPQSPTGDSEKDSEEGRSTSTGTGVFGLEGVRNDGEFLLRRDGGVKRNAEGFYESGSDEERRAVIRDKGKGKEEEGWK